MARLPELDTDRLSPEQRRVYDEIVAGPRGRVRGPLAIYLRRPGLAGPAQALGRYCRYDSALPPRLSELAILTMARIWDAEFEWWAHEGHALAAGLPREVVDAIASGAEPAFTAEDEAVVHEVTRTLHRERKLPDELYARALDVLGEDALIDLVGVLGYYSLVSMTLRVFEVEPPADAPRRLVRPESPNGESR